MSLTYFGCKVCQSVPIVMKLKLDMCHLHVYTKFQIGISQHGEKVRNTLTDERADRRTDIYIQG